MGLLTDPSSEQGKYIKLLINYQSKLCTLMYISAIIWFCLLAHNSISIPTNFSENALLPALVNSEFNEDSTAKTYYAELLDEMEKYQDSIPYPWLTAKFRQIGIDTYYHNFTLNYPLGKSQFEGKNVYGILRAARAASTESIVLSVPYRPPSSIYKTTTASVALMLAFAKFANRAQYWAKDIIFLVTEHEQLGVQAWLEAYHSASCGSKGVLEHGNLRGRAGSIQAAINLELHDIDIGYVDVKIEGLNGNLPNLDLVNLVYYMCAKEGVQHRFKNRLDYYVSDPMKKWKYSFITMLNMISTQSSGVPNGNHGLFHRFGIEAVTVEGFNDTPQRGGRVDISVMGRILEKLFRSLNNLLERFHQSYFFYLLLSTDRFVSIGLYIPIIMLLAGTLFIKPCAQWHQMNIFSSEKSLENQYGDDVNLPKVGIVLLTTHFIGILLMNSPQFLSRVGLKYGMSIDIFMFYCFGMLSLLMLILPVFMPLKVSEKNIKILNVLASLELGTMLIAIGMMNFSLALFCGLLYVPVVLIISSTASKYRKFFVKIFWLLLQPFVLMYIVVAIYTYLWFPDEMLKEIFKRSIVASGQALMFSIVDSIVYGNWMYNVVTAVLLPNWLCFWIVLSAKSVKVISKKKED